MYLHMHACCQKAVWYIWRFTSECGTLTNTKYEIHVAHMLIGFHSACLFMSWHDTMHQISTRLVWGTYWIRTHYKPSPCTLMLSYAHDSTHLCMAYTSIQPPETNKEWFRPNRSYMWQYAGVTHVTATNSATHSICAGDSWFFTWKQ
jgi:hypothetical protein